MTHNEEIAALRRNYSSAELLENEAEADAIAQFHLWFRQAISAEVPEPNAMCLSTVDSDGAPDARIVLLKGIENGGFVFYTNYLSTKGRQIEANPKVHLNFTWLELERQVRISGQARKVEPAESDAYFHSRPFESRIGAIVSRQSEVLDSREMLINSMEQSLSAHAGTEPERPEHWGGYLVIPNKIEFWQGRPGRLHDRLLYLRKGDAWEIRRLYP